MVASIGAVAAPSQGVSPYEKDGYHANDDPDHRDASAWAGQGARGATLFSSRQSADCGQPVEPA